MEAKGKKEHSCLKKEKRDSTASVLAISQRVESRLTAVKVNHLKKTMVPSYLFSDNIIFYPLNALQNKNLYSMRKTWLCPFIYCKHSEGIFKLGGS